VHQLPGQGQVPTAYDVTGLGGQVGDPVPHLAHRAPDLIRQDLHRVPAAGDHGDVDGVVPGALEVGRHAQRRDDPAQVGGHRLLAGQDVQREVVDRVVEVVDDDVAVDHPLGSPQVGADDRRRGTATASAANRLIATTPSVTCSSWSA
jgi:hypothetical protein